MSYVLSSTIESIEVTSTHRPVFRRGVGLSILSHFVIQEVQIAYDDQAFTQPPTADM